MNKFDINLNLYRSFYYVAKYGGFTKASQYAVTSQSALSSNIIKLEDVLGVKLFERKGANVYLTNAGKELFLKLENIANILNSETEKTVLNIGCIRSFADNYIYDAIKLFKQKYPTIRINIIFANNYDLYQLLKKDELDLVVSRYPSFYRFENYIHIEKIGDIQNVFACSKDYYNHEKKAMKERNYLYHVILPDSSEKRRIIEQYLIDNDINYNVELELPNSELLQKVIKSGIGIGYINKSYLEDEIKKGEIVILDNFKNIQLDNITIAYNVHINNPKIKEFTDMIKATIKKINS